MFEDVRYAARSVARAKGLTAVSVLSLALGTGANAAVGGIVHTLLFSAPPGVAGAGELVSIYTSEYSGAPYGRSSYPDFLSITSRRSVGEVAAVDDNTIANVRLGAMVGSARIASVTPKFFAVLRMQPHAGRFFSDADAATDPGPAVVSTTLAEALGSADDIVGKTITAGAASFIVVGVAPRRFRGLQAGRLADLWVPMVSGAALADRGDRRLSLVARRARSLDDMQRELDAAASALAEQYPQTNRGALRDPDARRRFLAAPYSPLDPATRSQTTMIAAVIVGAVALLLVSACVNAGVLLLARAETRRREIAVKMALGASRRRLARQVLTESLLISSAGGAVGLLFAVWIGSAVPSLFAPEQAELLDTRLDPLLFLLTVGIAVVAGAAFGIAPAVQGTSAPAASALRADSGGITETPSRSVTRSVLITAQLALSTLLVVATGLMIRGLSRALEGDFGIERQNVAVLGVENPGGSCRSYNAWRGERFQNTVATTLPQTPGIESVGWAVAAPLRRGTLRQYSIHTGAGTGDRVDLYVNVVTPGYFATLGISLVEGRFFDEGDRTLTEPVAIVDELLARNHFGARAVGEHLVDPDGERLRIVGVVRSGRYRTLQESPQPTVYVPLAQEYLPCGVLFVRTASDPGAQMPRIVAELKKIDRAATITQTTTLEQHLADALVVDRLATTLVGLCGIIALVMGAIGVYGAMSDAVLKRTREIGLRVALGAGRRQIVTLVTTEAICVTAAGVFVGVAGALAIERIAITLVHGLPALDVVTIVRAPAVLALVVAAAAALPLRRALSVNPGVALRAE
jgi:predicted permease